MEYPIDFINKVICGDCLSVMKLIPDKSIDLVLTDPPYGIGVQRVNCVSNRVDKRTREKILWDNSPIENLSELFRIGKNCIIWGGNYFNCFTTGGAIVWDKKQPLPDSSQCEIASITHYKKVFKYEQRWTNFVNTKDTEHPTEKPVDLMKFCINIFNSDTILDPFAGSGTTLVAAKELGRRFIGIEIEPKYVEICNRRLQQEYMNLGV
jgi:DNA modification methylase